MDIEQWRKRHRNGHLLSPTLGGGRPTREREREIDREREREML